MYWSEWDGLKGPMIHNNRVICPLYLLQSFQCSERVSTKPIFPSRL